MYMQSCLQASWYSYILMHVSDAHDEEILSYTRCSCNLHCTGGFNALCKVMSMLVALVMAPAETPPATHSCFANLETQRNRYLSHIAAAGAIVQAH